MALNRDGLLEALAHAERGIAAGAERIAKQREAVERLEAARGPGSTQAVLAQTLLVTMEKAQSLNIADRERIMRLLSLAESGSEPWRAAPPQG